MAQWLSGLCAELQVESQGFYYRVDSSFLIEEGVVE